MRAGLTDEALAEARLATSNDARLGAILRLARAIVDRRGRVGDEAIDDALKSDLSDADIVEVVANVALTTFTNYLNEVAGTDIDFPIVHHHSR
jgi:alkylhydroperoxidase family enzyme